MSAEVLRTASSATTSAIKAPPSSPKKCLIANKPSVNAQCPHYRRHLADQRTLGSVLQYESNSTTFLL